jgi:hypothetical protein
MPLTIPACLSTAAGAKRVIREERVDGLGVGFTGFEGTGVADRGPDDEVLARRDVFEHAHEVAIQSLENERAGLACEQRRVDARERRLPKLGDSGLLQRARFELVLESGESIRLRRRNGR